MSIIQALYPASSTVGLTISLASLASDSALLAGRQSAAVSNASSLDLDHLLSGSVQAGSSPTDGSSIEVWVYAPLSLSSGTPTYPDVITGADGNVSLTSSNVKQSALRLAQVLVMDGVSSRTQYMAPVSIAGLFGGLLPSSWGVFVVHNTGAALSSGAFQFTRLQTQTV